MKQCGKEFLELSFRMEMVESQPMLPVFSVCNSCATFTILENEAAKGKPRLALSHTVHLNMFHMQLFDSGIFALQNLKIHYFLTKINCNEIFHDENIAQYNNIPTRNKLVETLNHYSRDIDMRLNSFSVYTMRQRSNLKMNEDTDTVE